MIHIDQVFCVKFLPYLLVSVATWNYRDSDGIIFVFE